MGISNGPGQTVQLGHDQGVAGTAGRHGLAQPWPISIGSGESVIDIDPFRVDAEESQRIALCGEVLLIG